MAETERDPVFTVRLDAEHQAILEALTAHERLGKSDIFRRALRFYAEHLGLNKSAPKKKARTSIRKEMEVFSGSERARNFRF